MNINDFKNIVYQAGEIALKEQEVLDVQTKVDTSIVTNGDIKVSLFLEKELKNKFPDFDTFSEENYQIKPKSKKVFIIDPIDGTESYARKQDSWSILIGIVDDFEIVGGIIYQPTLNRLYYSFKGQGAFLEENGKTTPLNFNCSKDKITAVVSPKDYEEKNFLKQFNITETIPMFSAALKVMELAKGEADIYPSFRKKCSWWDLVAPIAITQEGGGNVVFENTVSLNFETPHVPVKFYFSNKRIKSDNLFLDSHKCEKN